MIPPAYTSDDQIILGDFWQNEVGGEGSPHGDTRARRRTAGGGLNIVIDQREQKLLKQSSWPGAGMCWFPAEDGDGTEDR